MNNRIYTVNEVNTYISCSFREDIFLRSICVRGEVSNCKRSDRGHIYFTLKDENAQIRCVMFAGQLSGISFHMQNGQKVDVYGKIDVYIAGGDYQLYASYITLAGVGDRYVRLEELKKKLELEGLFDESHKKKIPMYAKSVGIVTAAGGAAIHDIMQTAARRNPYVQLILCNSLVQGDGAAEEIANGVKTLDGKADVIIVGRGGGAQEDLWAFNEEVVARAIYACNTPVISAVGHETDNSLSDLVADFRCATPTAAAQKAVFDLAEFERLLAVKQDKMMRIMEAKVRMCRNEVSTRELKLKLLHPRNKLEKNKQKIDEIKNRMDFLIHSKIDTSKNRLEMAAIRLEGLSPVTRLKKGYALVSDSNGKLIRNTEDTNVGDTINIDISNGTIKALVTEKKDRKE